MQKQLSTPVLIFAYPFGNISEITRKKVGRYGYLAAVCVFPSNRQSLTLRYCLPRREIKREFSLERFAQILKGN